MSRNSPVDQLLHGATVFFMVMLLSGFMGCRDKPSGTSDPAARSGAGSVGGPGGSGKRGGRDMKFPVEVQQVRSDNVEYAATGVGSIEAFETVSVTARVAGAVERVRFLEGQTVRQGDVLVDIDPHRFRLAVDAERANHQKARASLAEAQAGLARREAANANSPGLIPAEQVQTFRTRVQTERAEVAQALAALNQAELNLRDAYVRAPVGGTIQTRTAQTGQYVTVGNVLATLVRRDPLLLRFKIAQQEALNIRPGMVARFTVVEKEPFMARISHVAASADPTSRMVDVTARVDDPRRGRLTPGSFAQVTVPIGNATQSAVVPQTAIRPSERGFVAFVVEGEVARERVLTLGMRTAEGLVEVKTGVKAGENLVIRGAEALKDGASVRIAKVPV